MKAYRIKVSGSYRNQEKNFIDFEGVEGIVPYNKEEVVRATVIKRYASMWILKDKENYPEKLTSIRRVDIDEMELIKDHKFSFVGKDIKALTYEEMQDLACAKGVRGIPLYKKLDLRSSLVQTYVYYCKEVLGKIIEWQKPEFNFIKLPAIKLDDTIVNSLTTGKDIEESLQDEVDDVPEPKHIKTSLTRADLEAIAASRNIQFSPNIGDDNLYKKIYG